MCFLCREQITLGCRVEALRSPKTSSCSHWMSESPRRRLKTRSSSSRSRSRSSGSSRYSRHYSRSPSLSSCRWVYCFCVVHHYYPRYTRYISIVMYFNLYTKKQKCRALAIKHNASGLLSNSHVSPSGEKEKKKIQ